MLETKKSESKYWTQKNVLYTVWYASLTNPILKPTNHFKVKNVFVKMMSQQILPKETKRWQPKQTKESIIERFIWLTWGSNPCEKVRCKVVCYF